MQMLCESTLTMCIYSIIEFAGHLNQQKSKIISFDRGIECGSGG